MLLTILKILLPFLMGIGITAYYFLKPKGETDAGWKLSERFLPFPSHASPAFNELLKKGGVPNYQVRQMVPPSKAIWKKQLQSMELARAEGIEKQVAALDIQIDSVNLGGVVVRKLIPATIDTNFANAIFIHIHGGAFVLNGGMNSVREGLIVANRLNMPVWSIDYRMPPDFPFPAALEDVVNVYKAIIREHPNKQIVMGGSSAGSQLVMAATLQLKGENIKLPNALQLSTPWSDLTKTGDSYYTNDGVDQLIVTNDGFLEACAKLYANGKDLKDPLLSPVYGDLSDFPPSQLISGSRDLFLSNTIRTYRKLRDAGVEADLIVLEGFSHAQHVLFYDTPESIAVYKDLELFLKKHL